MLHIKSIFSKVTEKVFRKGKEKDTYLTISDHLTIPHNITIFFLVRCTIIFPNAIFRIRFNRVPDTADVTIYFDSVYIIGSSGETGVP